MATLTTFMHEPGIDAADAATRASLDRIDVVPRRRRRPIAVQNTPKRPLDAHTNASIYLFIYRVRHGYDAYSWSDSVRHCTVFALGKCFMDAERIAINCVHQHGWRILKTDTATEFAIDRFNDGGTDAAHVANLRDFGVSFKLNH